MSRNPAPKQMLSGLRELKGEIKRYILLLLLPAFMCIILFLGVRVIITDQIQDRSELLASKFSVQVNSVLREIQLVGNSILNNKDFLNNLGLDGTPDCDAILELLSERKQESRYISHIYVISESLNRIYSEETSFVYKSLTALASSLGADPELLSSETHTQWYLLNEDGVASFCVMPIRSPNGDYVGNLVITLNMTDYLRMFFNFDASLCCIFNDDVYISTSLRKAPAQFDWRDEQAINEYVGEPVHCVYLKDENYTYLVAIPESDYYKPQQLIIACFCAYLILVLLFGSLYLHRVSKERYDKLSALVDALPQNYHGSASDSDFLADVRQSLLEFRTQSEDMATQSSLHNILYDYYEDHLSAAHLEAAGVYSPCGKYYVVSVFVNDAANIAPTATERPDIFALSQVIIRSTFKNFSAGKLNFTSCAEERSLVSVFGADTEENLKENVLAVCLDTEQLLAANYGMSVQITVSALVTDPRRLPDAFLEAKRLRSFAKAIDSDSPVILQEDLRISGGHLLSGDFVRQLQVLINTLLAGKYDVVPSMVQSILSEHVASLQQNYALADERLHMIAELLSESVSAANAKGFPAEEAAECLREASSVSLLNTAASSIFGRMAETVSSSNSTNSIMLCACEYINQNISNQNLNVADICEHAGVSVQRLTRMFRAQYDMAVAEYMNYQRVALAKTYLKDTSMSIARISALVGYNNTDTLARNFRKLEGLTPTEYRKLQES